MTSTGPWPMLAGTLLLLGLGALILPRLLGPDHPSGTNAAIDARVEEGPAGLDPQARAQLMDDLAAADREWIPRAEALPDGGTRYLYKRRSGDPELSIPEIKDLIDRPPSFLQERNAIVALLDSLERAQVRIDLVQPHKQGAAGEWDPRAGTLRIRPDVVEKGSEEFAKVLNHEAIHVAQSCGNGNLRAAPRPLGLTTRMDARLERNLDEPIYAKASPSEQVLEREAYANQHHLELGRALVESHCLS
ncbi:hypothetical protein VB716_05910 [Synechococcus sp. CCY9201]|uniref:hypothetical protein n=1 Tax=unclassified Synechococcus TaxID=2626047 RepID=UPI002AD56ACA|nr:MULTISPECIES: hypothetical protein [unclassified Synechococcus]MEA5473752.1 hypothetical protein [Synechococcus sp. CCY9201]